MLSVFDNDLEWVWSVFLVLIGIGVVGWKLEKWVVRPYLMHRFYRKQLVEQGYRVYVDGFVPFNVPMVFRSMKDEKQHNDGLYHSKYELSNKDIILTNIAEKIVLILITPSLIKQFYLLDGTPSYIKQKEFIKNIKRIASEAITFSEGEEWKIKRKFITGFLNFGFVNQQVSVIFNTVDRKLQQFSNGKDQFDIYLLELLEQIASSTMIQLFFGGGKTKIQNFLIEGIHVSKYMRILVEHLGEQTLDPLNFFLGQGFSQLNLRGKDRVVSREVRKFREFTGNFVKQRVQEIRDGKSTKEDYVKKMYESVSEEERTPKFIQKLVSEFSSLYIAGTDTTSHAALMVMYYLVMYPQVQIKLLREIEKYVGNGEDITYEEIKNIGYLDCVIHECLRIYQPANGIFIREATNDHMLGDLKIKKGTLIMISSLTNHYNDENFENASEFRPERWLSEEGVLKTVKPFTWLTFSAGQRSCLGKQLALLELKIIVIQILRRYEIKMQTTQLIMKMHNFSYQPQKLLTKLMKRRQIR